jgi:hypothetical protein
VVWCSLQQQLVWVQQQQQQQQLVWCSLQDAAGQQSYSMWCGAACSSSWCGAAAVVAAAGVVQPCERLYLPSYKLQLSALLQGSEFYGEQQAGPDLETSVMLRLPLTPLRTHLLISFCALRSQCS